MTTNPPDTSLLQMYLYIFFVKVRVSCLHTFGYVLWKFTVISLDSSMHSGYSIFGHCSDARLYYETASGCVDEATLGGYHAFLLLCIPTLAIMKYRMVCKHVWV